MKVRFQLGDQPVTLEVPEGVDPGEYVDQVAARHSEQEVPSAASESGMENFAAGLGRSGANLGRNVANLANFALPEGMEIEAGSDENILEANARDADLLDSTGGMLGNIAGEVAATAAPAGAVVKGARLAKAARAAGKVPTLGGKLAATMARNPVKYGMGEAAAVEGLAAGPDQRLKRAAQGAAGAGAAGGLVKALSRTGRGLVQRTDAAKEFTKEYDQFLPVSSAAKTGGISGAARNVYEHLIPALPFTRKGTIGAQEEAADAYAKKMLANSLPPTGGVVDYNPELALESMDEFKRIWDEAYAPFKGYKLKVNSDAGWTPKLARAIKRLSREDQKPFKPYLDENRMMDSEKLLEIRSDLIDSSLKSKHVGKKAIRNAISAIDDVFTEPAGFLPAALRKQYKAMAPQYQNAKSVMKAAGKSTLDRFGPQGVVKSAPKGSAFRQTAAKAQRAVGDKALKDPGFWQRVVATGAVLGAGGGIGGPAGLAVALGALGLGKTLSAKNLQKVLMGDTKAQQALADLLIKHGKSAEFIQYITQAAGGRAAGAP